MLRRANLPDRVRLLKADDYRTKAKDLLAYLGSDAYAKDFTDAKGVCLSGDASVRSDLLALMAKGLALQDRGTWFCSVHYLVNLLDHGTEEERNRIGRYANLFVDWFEKDFGSDACPYSLHQRAEVEEFLTARMRSGLITNFSACKRWDNLKWWSRDFLAMYKPLVVDVTI